MKPYVGVFITVALCSCFVQGAVNSSGRRLNSSSSKRQLLRTESKPKAQQQQQQPSSNYKYLEKVNDDFWSMWEELNKNQFGKLETRMIRNALTDILSSRAFWDELNKTTKRYNKMVNREKVADKWIEMINKIAEVLSNSKLPTNMLQEQANSFYNEIKNLKLNTSKNFLDTVNKFVDSGEVNNNLSYAQNYIKSVDLDPNMLTKCFKNLKNKMRLSSFPINDNLVRMATNTFNKYNSKKSANVTKKQPDSVKVLDDDISIELQNQ